MCKIHFDNDSEDRQAEWIGYSGCWRWSHYDCAGFKHIPEDEVDWFCDACNYLISHL